MALIDINDESFREIYQKNEIIILDFWAIWCGPCHQFAPIFEEVSKKYEDIVFGKVDTESEVKLPGYFQVRGIPTIVIIRNQIEVFRHSGVLDERTLIEVIERIKSLDMDEVEKFVEEEEDKKSNE